MDSIERFWKLWLGLQLVVLVDFDLVLGQDETLIATPTAQDNLISPGYPTSNYSANLTYEYLVYTNYPNHSLTLTVLDCQIEVTKNGDCIFDHLYIYDGPNSNASLIVDFCCPASNPHQSFATTGNQSYLVFDTDATFGFKGFKLSYVSTGITTTTTQTTTTTTTTTTTPAPAAPATSDGGGNTSLYIIIGCVVGGLLLLILLILLICCCIKKSRPVTPTERRDTKRVLWSRSNTTMVKEFPGTPAHLPPGSVTQVDIFTMNLPGEGRGNLLPPLSSKLELPGPAVEAPPIGDAPPMGK